MAERTTAEDRLEMLFHILAFASAEEGATLPELAEALGTTPEEVRRCIEEVTARAFYQPAGTPDPLQVSIEDDRVHVWTGGEFRRPPRLTGHEVLALELGLRVLAGDAPPERTAAILDLVRRLTAQLAAPGVDTLSVPDQRSTADARAEARRRAEARIEREGSPPPPMDEADVQELLLDAVEQRHIVRISYLKPGGDAPEQRTIAPYTLVQATGRWYILAHDRDRDDVRLFRIDRVLDVLPMKETFEVPAGFDAREHLGEDGIAFAADAAAEAVVRYSARVAPWLVERLSGELQEDGALIVRHSVSETDWLVRHVLPYGGDAEVIETTDLRRRVAETAERIAKR